MPLGLPCSTFSLRNAQPSINSVSSGDNSLLAERCECTDSSDVATHVENAAEEPRPALMGRLADAVNVKAGLLVSSFDSSNHPTDAFELLPAMTM